MEIMSRIENKEKPIYKDKTKKIKEKHYKKASDLYKDYEGV